MHDKNLRKKRSKKELCRNLQDKAGKSQLKSQNAKVEGNQYRLQKVKKETNKYFYKKTKLTENSMYLNIFKHGTSLWINQG